MRSATAVLEAARSCGGDAVSPPAIPAAVKTPAPGADYAGADGPSSETAAAGRNAGGGLFRMPYQRWAAAEIADLRERLKTQVVKQIADDLGMEASALRMVLHRAGIKAREFADNGLPPRAALLVRLADEGLSRTEIAARMGITERSATAYLSRARKRLRDAGQ